MKDSCSFCPSFKLDSSLFSRVSGQGVLWALRTPAPDFSEAVFFYSYYKIFQ
jgi:hypothetical protein